MSASVLSGIRQIVSLDEIADPYDLFVVDIWGVIYDGITLLPDALACLRKLRSQSKTVVLLSNSTVTGENLARTFRPMGLEPGMADRIVTSGDYVGCLLKEFQAREGVPCFLVGQDRHKALLETLEIPVTEDPAEARFVFLGGLPHEGEKPWRVEDFDLLLSRLAGQNLPMICANPDLYSMRGKERVLCPGSLAEHYKVLGGHVVVSGKPDPAIYRYALQPFAGLDSLPRKVLCIGDGMRTDIRGGQTMGWDTLWIMGGVHQDLLELAHPEEQEKAVHALCTQEGCLPTYRQRRLR